MSLAEELGKLEALRTQGVLSQSEFDQAKRRLLDGPAPPGGGGSGAASAINRLRRSRSDKWIGGVCGGLAAITGVESWAWRLILTVLFLFGGAGGLLYILLWIFVPLE
jgi:phage shock protein PspC (stress-responsive transcriptional regulator)